jgi:hypothetical protein
MYQAQNNSPKAIVFSLFLPETKKEKKDQVNLVNPVCCFLLRKESIPNFIPLNFRVPPWLTFCSN